MEHHSPTSSLVSRSGAKHQSAASLPILPILMPYCQLTTPDHQSVCKQRMMQLSNWASILCVIDCTVLPIVTLLLSLLGLTNDPHRMEWLHHLGHQLAVYFVLPVGSLTAVLNYFAHRRASMTAPALLALVLIYFANSKGGHHGSPHHDSHHHDTMSEDTNWFQSILPDGMSHRIFNVLGCVLLLHTNYRSQKAGACQHKNCKAHSVTSAAVLH